MGVERNEYYLKSWGMKRRGVRQDFAHSWMLKLYILKKLLYTTAIYFLF